MGSERTECDSHVFGACETQCAIVVDNKCNYSQCWCIYVARAQRMGSTTQRLVSLSVNAATLRSIESAAFAICLDDRDYGHDLTDTCRSMWLGNDATNRWFDKTLQIIVSNDG